MLPCTPGPFFDMASREPHSPAAFFPRQSPWMPNAVVPNIYKVKGTILSLEVVDWISNTPSCFEFRVETIKWIQDRLTDVDLAKTDDTIGAIMTLAMWEVRLPSLPRKSSVDIGIVISIQTSPLGPH
jgi:hypothetical protein